MAYTNGQVLTKEEMQALLANSMQSGAAHIGKGGYGTFSNLDDYYKQFSGPVMSLFDRFAPPSPTNSTDEAGSSSFGVADPVLSALLKNSDGSVSGMTFKENPDGTFTVANDSGSMIGGKTFASEKAVNDWASSENSKGGFGDFLKIAAPLTIGAIGLGGGLSGLLGSGSSAGIGGSSAASLAAADAAAGLIPAAGTTTGLLSGGAALTAEELAAAAAADASGGLLTSEQIAAMGGTNLTAAQLAAGANTLANAGTAATAASGAKGLLDTLSTGAKVAGLAGGLISAATSKDGTTTTTREPWAPMQPYLLDHAKSLSDWYKANKGGSAETNALVANLPTFNQQTQQRVANLNNYANNYAARRGLLGGQ